MILCVCLHGGDGDGGLRRFPRIECTAASIHRQKCIRKFLSFASDECHLGLHVVSDLFRSGHTNVTTFRYAVLQVDADVAYRC